jgi:hypothetical protein
MLDRAILIYFDSSFSLALCLLSPDAISSAPIVSLSPR